MDNQYPANSDKSQQEPQYLYGQKRVTAPAINGGAKINEKTVWSGISDFFGIGECKSFRDYVATLSDITNRVYGAVDILLGNRKNQTYGVASAKPQYSAYYSNPVQQTAPQQAPAPAAQPGLEYGPYYITYARREEAEIVLAKMIELLGIYKNVSIGDMFDFAGLTDPHGYTNVNYGWRSLEGVRVIPYGSRWAINVPPATVIRQMGGQV